MTSERRYLWFAPHAGLWPSFRMEHRLAEAVARQGRAVTMLHCRGVLDSYCPVMSADRLTVESPRSARRQSCLDCRHNARLTGESAAYATRWLDDVVDERMLHEVDSLMADVTRSNWLDVTLEDIPVGRYSAYLTMLHHKLPDVTSSDGAWLEYRSDLRNALLVGLAMPHVMEEANPTHVVVYNPLYPTNRMFAEYAQRHGATLVGLHAGAYVPARYETVGVYHHISASQTLVDSSTVRESMQIPCTPAEIRAVEAQLRALMAGSDPWVYSSAAQPRDPAELRAALGVRPAAPVVVVLLSSPDETRSSMLVEAEYHRAPERGYSDIAEFIAAARELAESLPQLDVVLRLHPRLAANKREPVSSPDLASILDALSNLPHNAHVNTPTDGVSLYDLAGIASAALNQSSSSGLEFLALGVPVVSYDPVRQNAYPPDFGSCVDRRDPEALAAAVTQAVSGGADLANSVRAFRWYATIFLRVLLHLSDLVTDEGTPDPADVAPAEVGMGAGRASELARRLVPEGARARGARWMARRRRALPDPTREGGWLEEWIARLDAVAGGRPVWEPLVVVRGTPDAGAERELIEAAVAGLRQGLGFGPDLDR